MLVVDCLSKYREAAALLFEDIAATSPRFHPHPLTRSFAEEHTWNLDIYVVAMARIKDSISAVGYGMLRGWDAGYDVPSLGVAVSSNFRGFGLGRLMMEHLHVSARIRGSAKVRLRVYDDNKVAIRLYESLGYEWMPVKEYGQRVGILNL